MEKHRKGKHGRIYPYALEPRANGGYLAVAECSTEGCSSQEQVSLRVNLPEQVVVKKFIQHGWEGEGHLASGVPRWLYCPSCKTTSKLEPKEKRMLEGTQTAEVPKAQPTKGYSIEEVGLTVSTRGNNGKSRTGSAPHFSLVLTIPYNVMARLGHPERVSPRKRGDSVVLVFGKNEHYKLSKSKSDKPSVIIKLATSSLGLNLPPYKVARQRFKVHCWPAARKLQFTQKADELEAALRNGPRSTYRSKGAGPVRHLTPQQAGYAAPVAPQAPKKAATKAAKPAPKPAAPAAAVHTQSTSSLGLADGPELLKLLNEYVEQLEKAGWNPQLRVEEGRVQLRMEVT